MPAQCSIGRRSRRVRRWPAAPQLRSKRARAQSPALMGRGRCGPLFRLAPLPARMAGTSSTARRYPQATRPERRCWSRCRSTALKLRRTPAPSANPDTFSTAEEAALVLPSSGVGSPAANDTDFDGDALVVTAVSAPSGGTVYSAPGRLLVQPHREPLWCGGWRISATRYRTGMAAPPWRGDGQHHVCQ